MSVVTAEVHQGRAGWHAFKADWDRLMHERENEPSVSFEWTASLMESHVKAREEVAVIILKNQNVVLGIVPLVLRTTTWLGQRLTELLPVSELSNTHSDLLIRDCSEHVLAAFVDALYRLELRWDVFGMKRLVESHPLGALWSAVLRRRGKWFELNRTDPSFFLTLDRSYEQYLKRRSSSFRNALKRIERKLKDHGRIELRHQGSFDTADEAYDTLMSIEQRSWKETHGTSISAVSRQAIFYRHLCAMASQKGWLHIRFLYLNERPVAYNLGILVHGTYYYLKTSYDQAERPWSPSTYLRAELIKELIGGGVKHFDFPAEPYEWERQWSDELRWHQSLTLFGPTAKGMAYGLYRKAKRLRRSNDASTISYANPRTVTPNHS